MQRDEIKIHEDRAQILNMLAGGASQKDVARRLEISHEALRKRLQRLKIIVGAKSTGELIAIVSEAIAKR